QSKSSDARTGAIALFQLFSTDHVTKLFLKRTQRPRTTMHVNEEIALNFLALVGGAITSIPAVITGRLPTIIKRPIYRLKNEKLSSSSPGLFAASIPGTGRLLDLGPSAAESGLPSACGVPFSDAGFGAAAFGGGPFCGVGESPSLSITFAFIGGTPWATRQF